MPTIVDRIEQFADDASDTRSTMSPPADPPDEERALHILRHGFGPTVWLYVEARTGEWVQIDTATFNLLQQALNDWLECYAICYGYNIDANVSVREAAEALLDTHNVHDVAQLLTHVPDRGSRSDG